MNTGPRARRSSRIDKDDREKAIGKAVFKGDVLPGFLFFFGMKSQVQRDRTEPKLTAKTNTLLPAKTKVFLENSFTPA